MIFNLAMKRSVDNDDEDDDDESPKKRAVAPPKVLNDGVRVIHSVPATSLQSVAVGYLDDALTYQIRAYLDVLLGSVMSEKQRLFAIGVRDSVRAIPTIVQDVLAYNNVYFNVVRLFTVAQELPEITAYRIDVPNNRLELFVNVMQYNEFCNNASENCPVTVSDGVVNLEKYNPARSACRETLDAACINCAVMCDHVAQHIINEIYTAANNDLMPIGRDIHYRYTTYGTTLHSMFDITLLGTKQPPSDGGTTLLRNQFTLLNRLGNNGIFGDFNLDAATTVRPSEDSFDFRLF